MDPLVAIPAGLALLSAGCFVAAVRGRTPTMAISPRGADVAGTIFGAAAAVTAVRITEAPVWVGLTGLGAVLLIMLLLYVAAGPRAALQRAKNPPPEPEPASLTIGTENIEVQDIHSMRIPPPLPGQRFVAPKLAPVDPHGPAVASNDPYGLAAADRAKWAAIEKQLRGEDK